jgi:Cdc6-like AAA superfamily ATPase
VNIIIIIIIIIIINYIHYERQRTWTSDEISRLLPGRAKKNKGNFKEVEVPVDIVAKKPPPPLSAKTHSLGLLLLQPLSATLKTMVVYLDEMDALRSYQFYGMKILILLK